MQTAIEILHQLGGKKFVAMTGAKQFVAGENSLHFSLPARFAKDGINKVKIALNSADLYDVTFYKYSARKLELETIATDGGIYADMLCDVFTARTGLDTRIGKVFIKQ